MKSEIQELKGKYYGTEILITDEDVDDGRGRPYEDIIVIWGHADGVPSGRELEAYGATSEDWVNDAEIPDCNGGTERISAMVDFNHFESQWTLDLCKTIVNAINNK